VRVGIYLDLRNPPQWRRPWAEHYARSLDLCEEADRLGAGSVWLSEHHFFEDGYLPQPLTFAAAVAARTTTVRIGTAVLLAALRHPVQIVEEATIVDLVSNGRLDLGIGAGYRVPEYTAFGLDVRDRYALTEARIREIGRLLGEGSVTPPPVQEPLPIWGGFLGPRGARLAGRLGIGLLAVDRGLFEP
jgi:alkanesulfonate monooxygenase SsuD/methylene tetrahydromethanopterin reductase-like flavin-dependent oxidoreductase (luciferase family)